MNNFTYQLPTKIIFGRGTENTVGSEVANYSKKILLHFGGKSAEKSGLLGRVRASLQIAGIEWIELGGVQPNPVLSLVRKGIERCRRDNVGFVLAVGGGSVIDSSKAIAAGVFYEGDVWDFYSGDAAPPTKALPVGAILTIPASGSESSPGSVITKEEGALKRAVNADCLYPRFSILNPELAFTLPADQIANGVADIMAHLMERYFTNTPHVEFGDRLIEAALRTVIASAPLLFRGTHDYDAWAEVMWAGDMAHNNLLDRGRVGDWGSHGIERELSGIYDVAHGAGLAVIFPAWMKYVYRHDVARFAQFAARVWGVEPDYLDVERTAIEGIARLEAFWKSIGLPLRLSELGIGTNRIDELALRCTENGSKKIGHLVELDTADIAAIYRAAE
ncbi:putative NADH-dependent butanol dehydrogenase 1 [uncultured spirochete]|uniref:Putative NADH-dependent butanol dehydrogenase 1 n=1 Tax=uncultured spirochete TaxID=156406 RepID=A0A3P3XN19_9SPIR|nr:putative NADH-dependent butanol dehydrogenase 1 [uncultured spirochete]